MRGSELSFKTFLTEQIHSLRRQKIQDAIKSRIVQGAVELIFWMMCGIVTAIWVKGWAGVILILLGLGFGWIRYCYRWWQDRKEGK